jgi:NADH-quinone oxidoreductase subunit L
MTFPLMALAVGALVAGLVGVPSALWGTGSAIETFLEPSFTAQEVRLKPDTTPAGEAAGESRGVRLQADQAEAAHEGGEAHASRGVELGLMAFSVVIAIAGIMLARKFYVTSPEISERLAVQWAGAHRLLLNKFYVDELYNATVVALTVAGGGFLWLFDRKVVDGAVNGTGWVTIISAWFSGLTDRTIVDGAVNLVGRVCEEGSFWFRKLQTGLVQNYALLMLFGVFAFVTVYLFLR